MSIPKILTFHKFLLWSKILKNFQSTITTIHVEKVPSNTPQYVKDIYGDYSLIEYSFVCFIIFSAMQLPQSLLLLSAAIILMTY